MSNKNNKLIRGFTIIELVVAMSIFMILIFGVSKMLNDIFVNSSQALVSITNIDQARGVLSAFTNEIRDATNGTDGSYALSQAGDSQIIFFSNFGTSNGIAERIRYYVSGNSLYKGIVIPTGSPLSYNLSSETVGVAVSGISNGNSPAFYYYDGNYNGTSSALAQPVNINQVRFVKINAMVLNEITPGGKSAFSITSGSAIRSLKDNLGN